MVFRVQSREGSEYGGVSSISLYGWGRGGEGFLLFKTLKKHSEYRVVHIIELFGIVGSTVFQIVVLEWEKLKPSMNSIKLTMNFITSVHTSNSGNLHCEVCNATKLGVVSNC